MITSAVALLVVALIAGMLGLFGVASAATFAAWILYGIGLITVIMMIVRSKSST